MEIEIHPDELPFMSCPPSPHKELEAAQLLTSDTLTGRIHDRSATGRSLAIAPGPDATTTSTSDPGLTARSVVTAPSLTATIPAPTTTTSPYLGAHRRSLGTSDISKLTTLKPFNPSTKAQACHDATNLFTPADAMPRTSLPVRTRPPGDHLRQRIAVQDTDFLRSFDTHDFPVSILAPPRWAGAIVRSGEEAKSRRGGFPWNITQWLTFYTVDELLLDGGHLLLKDRTRLPPFNTHQCRRCNWAMVGRHNGAIANHLATCEEDGLRVACPRCLGIFLCRGDLQAHVWSCIGLSKRSVNTQWLSLRINVRHPTLHCPVPDCDHATTIPAIGTLHTLLHLSSLNQSVPDVRLPPIYRMEREGSSIAPPADFDTIARLLYVVHVIADVRAAHTLDLRCSASVPFDPRIHSVAAWIARNDQPTWTREPTTELPPTEQGRTQRSHQEDDSFYIRVIDIPGFGNPDTPAIL